jgi:deoxyribodipyrimidine photo-lyase
MNFHSDYDAVLHQIDNIDPVRYGRTRNFVDGAVTKLSPYISRGVISTRQVMQSVLKKGYEPGKIEKFLQELAWRDYWQQIWIEKGAGINQDLRHPQPGVENHEMPISIEKAATGISAIDKAIEELYETGYMHNHVRMYSASLACNIGGSHWLVPAKWMYYHLLDGDWASNALSWQWVSGANSGKKYYANQQNINKYCYTDQSGTFLDCWYDDLQNMPVPDTLKETAIPQLNSKLPEGDLKKIDPTKPTLVYNYYNLDPVWHRGEDCNRILLLEPSTFRQYPVGPSAINFMIRLSKNIAGLKVYVGEFLTLMDDYQHSEVRYKEHPLNDYQGIEEPRDWMFGVKGYHRSFFAFWKKCSKELKQWRQQTLFG